MKLAFCDNHWSIVLVICYHFVLFDRPEESRYWWSHVTAGVSGWGSRLSQARFYAILLEFHACVNILYLHSCHGNCEVWYAKLTLRREQNPWISGDSSPWYCHWNLQIFVAFDSVLVYHAHLHNDCTWVDHDYILCMRITCDLFYKN